MGKHSRKSLLASPMVLALLLLFVAAEASLPMGARGQWRIVAPNLLPGNGGGIASGGAMHFKDGIIWAGSNWDGSDPPIFFSADTGKTWQSSPFSGNVYDISFFDRNIGVVGSENGLYLTKDGAQTWYNILYGSTVVSAAFGKSDSVIYAVDQSDQIDITTDMGNTWQTHAFGKSVGQSFTIGKDGMLYMFSFQGPSTPYSGSINSSADGGKSWSQSTGSTFGDSYSLIADSCTPGRLYLANENYVTSCDNLSRICVSPDGGHNWQTCFTAPMGVIAGGITASFDAVYAGTFNNAGVLRSLDNGQSWVSISGPSLGVDDRDIVALNDNILFVQDQEGSIWATFNSGGDSIPTSISSAFSAAPSTLFATDTILCDSVSRSIQFRAGGCSPPSVSTYSIVGPDSASFEASDLSNDSISVTLRGDKQGNQHAQLVLSLDNGSSDTVSLAGYVDRPLDTLIASPVTLFAADTLICDSLNCSVFFNSGGCSPPSVSRVWIAGEDSASFSASKLSNDSVLVTLYPSRQGAQHATLILALDNGSSDTVKLAGFVNRPPNILRASPVAVFTSDTISCDSITHSISFSREGCLPPSVSSFSIIGLDSTSFDASNLSFDSISVTLHGIKQGKQNAQLILALDNGASDTVTLAGYVNRPPDILSASPAILFATDSISCDSVTHSISFSRNGCSPPSISSYSIIGPDSASFVASNLSYDSILVTLRGIKQGNQNAKLVLTLDNGSNDTVSLAGYVNLQPNALSLSTADAKTATLGATVAVPITISGLAHPEDVDLVLHYDGSVDYLGSFSPSGAKLDVPGGEWLGRSMLHISGAAPGVIAGYAKFTAWNDSNTNAHATFDSLNVLTAISPCEYSLPEAATSTISTPTGCAIPLLSQLVHLGKVPVFRVVPNPSDGNVSISSSIDLGAVTIVIYDILGTERSRFEEPMVGNAPVTLPLPDADGIYTIVLNSTTGTNVLRVARRR